MNTYGYIEKIKMNVNNYLEGFIINKNKIDASEITPELKLNYLLKHFTPEISEMFYQKPLYRAELNKFIMQVQWAYGNLIDTELEFAGTKEEADTAVAQFEQKLKEIISDFQEGVYEVIKGKEGYQTNVIHNYLASPKIKIVKDGESREENEPEKLKDVVPALYIMHEWIKDKCEKIFEYKTYVENNYQKNTHEYASAYKNYIKMLNKTDYKEFIKFYNEVVGVTNSKTRN